MLQQNLITKLLGIANVFVEKIENNSAQVEIHLSTQAKEQICPCCGQTTKYIHDYRIQKIRDIPFQGKETFLFLRKRRYVCQPCGKRFFEKYDFLPKYRHFTGRVYTSVINALREKISFKDVGKRFGISSASVFRIFEYIAVTTPTSTTGRLVGVFLVMPRTGTTTNPLFWKNASVYTRTFYFESSESLRTGNLSPTIIAWMEILFFCYELVAKMYGMLYNKVGNELGGRVF